MAALVLICALASAIGWLILFIRMNRWSRAIPVLNAETVPHRLEKDSKVSVIVAAKDEEANIREIVHSILAQDAPDFELIVVNDRSSDRTADILQELQTKFESKLRVVTITELPPGWGGQSHAIHCGVNASSGRWLCFTDADCRFLSNQTLTLAMGNALSCEADLLSIFPEMATQSIWEKIYLPICCLLFMNRLKLGQVNTPSLKPAYANGAFMLMRKSVYEAIGGHRSVRDKLNDDIAIAHRAKREGFNVKIAGNSGLVSTRMYPSIKAAWNGWTRNYVGAISGRWRLLTTAGISFVLYVLPWLVFVASSWSHYEGLDESLRIMTIFVAITSIAMAHLGMWIAYPSFGSSALMSLFCLPGALFVTAIQIRAAMRVWTRQSVKWHGVSYTSDQGL